MLHLISKLSCSLLLVLWVSVVAAQNQPPPAKEDTVVRYRPKKPDSLKVKFYPRSIRFGTDLISIVKTEIVPSFKGWEVNADVDCGKLYLAFDYGSWGRNYQIQDSLGSYSNNGTYWRFGVDFNLLKKDPDKNMFFIGARYGHASYNETSDLVLKDAIFGRTEQHYHNSAVTGTWVELTTGLRVKIWKDFWMGYTARMKFAPGTKGATQLTSYDIPGYGLQAKGLYWGFNYQIFYSIPIKKEKKKKVAVVKSEF